MKRALRQLELNAPAQEGIIHGRSEELLRWLPADSVDALVTDPPAGIGFMGREWDGDKGGRASWIAWLAGVMRGVFRVMKPGAHGLVWALPRTSHWTAMALEDAGFEVRDRLSHLFGTGFPKSLNVSKALDDAAGAERRVVGSKLGQPGYSLAPDKGRGVPVVGRDSAKECTITAPATDAAKLWSGYGTALKPACEDWWLIRKPLVGTVAQNILAHGTGGLNIDGCRIATEDDTGRPGTVSKGGILNVQPGGCVRQSETHTQGRWPANVLLDEAAAAELDAQSGHMRGGEMPAKRSGVGFHSRAKGTAGERVVLDAGGASRFFYVAKPSRRERDAGLERFPVRSGGEATDREEGTAALKSPRTGAGRGGGVRNHHPTVKPIALMRYLVRLITPPRGLVLDPFAGSGTTAVAAALEGRRYTAIEQDAEYVELARARVAHWMTTHQQP